MSPCANTSTRSAASAVDRRWATLTVVRPSARRTSAVDEGPLGLGIDRGGRLVEDQQSGVGELRAGQRDELALADRQALAPLARPRCRGRRAAGRPTSRGRARANDVLDRRRSVAPVAAHAHVVARPSRRTGSRPGAPCGPRVRRDAGSTSRRSTPPMRIRPVGRVGQPAQQLGEGRLARTGLADDGDVRPGGDVDGRRRAARARPSRYANSTPSTRDRRARRRQRDRRARARSTSTGMSSTSSTLRQPAMAVWVWSRISPSSAIGGEDQVHEEQARDERAGVEPPAGPHQAPTTDDRGQRQAARRCRRAGT